MVHFAPTARQMAVSTCPAVGSLMNQAVTVRPASALGTRT